MRLVRAVDEVVDAVQAARREAMAAFGDGTLYVERLIERPRTSRCRSSAMLTDTLSIFSSETAPFSAVTRK